MGARLRQPVLVSYDQALLQPADTSTVSGRHLAYSRRVRELSNGKIGGLRIMVVGARGSRYARSAWEIDGCRAEFGTLKSLLLRLPYVQPGRQAPLTWIAGDPFRNGLAALLLHSRSGGKLQIQCHGDFGDQTWARSTKDQVKRLLAARTLPRAASVRAVSGPQASKLMKAFGVAADRLFVAPVPVAEAFFDASVQGPNDRPVDVYFVGRMHPERGIDLWAQTADALSQHGSGFRFHIVGSGPLEPNFRGLLASQSLRSRTTWHGSLPPQELATLFGTSGSRGVLLNTAPLEAYGRSMAEAALCGLRVVALKTSGAEALTGLFPGIEIVPDADPVSLAHSVAGLEGLDDPPGDLPGLRKSYRLIQESATDQLVRSWLW